MPERMMVRSTACCGLYELSGVSQLGGPSKAAEIVAATWAAERIRPPFILFSGVSGTRMPKVIKHGYGEALETFIKEGNLGEVTKTPTRYNPNSENDLTIWVWSVNWETLLAMFPFDKTNQIQIEKCTNPNTHRGIFIRHITLASTPKEDAIPTGTDPFIEALNAPPPANYIVDPAVQQNIVIRPVQVNGTNRDRSVEW